MKTKILLTAVSSFFILHSAFGQGALTPPGAPAPTMKTLAQIEPRTPISAAPFNITQSGSYYLTTNLTTTVSNAIVISANGVTLDLNGFTISSTVANAANGGYAILLAGTATAGLSDITIVNGHIRGGVTNNGSGVYSGPGFAYGIYYLYNVVSGYSPVNTRVSGVSVSGCLNHGIYLNTGDATVVEACTVRTVGSFGIVASTVKGSVAVDCGSFAITGDQVSDCRGQSRNDYGLYASSSALNCYGESGNNIGLFARTAQNCYGTSSSGYGLAANNIAQNCYGTSSNNIGLAAETAQNCCGTSSSDTGLNAFFTASGCYGTSDSGTGLYAPTALNCYGTSSSSTGLNATTAQNCSGSSSSSGTGLNATTAQNCSGFSGSGTGLYAGETASGCYGTSSSGTGCWGYEIAIGCVGRSTSGIGVRANILNSCVGYGTPAYSYNFKYNMP